jgi:hypothetical protein
MTLRSVQRRPCEGSEQTYRFVTASTAGDDGDKRRICVFQIVHSGLFVEGKGRIAFNETPQGVYDEMGGIVDNVFVCR